VIEHYWQSLGEWEPKGSFNILPEDSGASEVHEGQTRRDFLKTAGFALAGAAVAGCSRAPVEKAVPYVVQPEETVAGRPQYYASVCGACRPAAEFW
jgi:molybdopterin-containing oxidoreductase family iron-sulfur binding subunit